MTNVIAIINSIKTSGSEGSRVFQYHNENIKEFLKKLLKDPDMSEIDICGGYGISIITLIKIEDKWEVRWRDFE